MTKYPRIESTLDFSLRLRHDPQTGCFEWQGTRDAGGYGRYSNKPAHRMAWELHRGPIPDGMFVCHHCDNPPCCRLSHLFLGDHAANMADMVSKGRQSRQGGPPMFGTSNGSAKLEEIDVLAILRLLNDPEFNQYQIATIFGVSRKTIRNIRDGNKWSWLTDTN